jgi:hypothetical protein
MIRTLAKAISNLWVPWAAVTAQGSEGFDNGTIRVGPSWRF